MADCEKKRDYRKTKVFRELRKAMLENWRCAARKIRLIRTK